MSSDTVETLEFMGGPADGHTLPYRWRPGTDMPLAIPGSPRYELAALDARSHPPRWRYRWRPDPPGRRRPCRNGDHCIGAGCPNRHAGAQ